MAQGQVLLNGSKPSGSTLRLRIEHQRDAFGIGMARPRLSWIVETQGQGWHQAACEIEMYDTDR